MSDHPSDHKPEPVDLKWAQAFGLIFQIGLYLVSGAGLGLLAGLLCQRYFGLHDIFMIAFIVGGMALGFYGAFRVLMEMVDD